MPAHFLVALFIIATVFVRFSVANEETYEESLLKTDLFLLEIEYLNEEILSIEQTPKWYLIKTLTLGGGFTDNVYSGRNSLSSYYFIGEGDVFFNYFPDKPWRFQNYTYFQLKSYKGPETINDEWVFLSQFLVERFFNSWILEFELTEFYGDQFFDGTEIPSIPIGSRVITHQPTAELRAILPLNKKHDLISDIHAGREELNVEAYNQWTYGSSLKLKSKWKPSLTTEISITYDENKADQQVVRDESGYAISDQALRESNIELFALITWKTKTPHPLSISLYTKYDELHANEGAYEDYKRIEFAFRFEVEFANIDWQLQGSHSEQDFDYRRSDIILPGILYRDRDRLSLEIEKELKSGYTLNTRMGWEQLRSPVDDDNFQTNYFELSLKKSF